MTRPPPPLIGTLGRVQTWRRSQALAHVIFFLLQDLEIPVLHFLTGLAPLKPLP